MSTSAAFAVDGTPGHAPDQARRWGLDGRMDEAHQLDMRRHCLFVALALVMTGCSPDASTGENVDDFRARQAAYDLLCAPDREDRNLALGAFAVAISATPTDEREDTAWEVAEAVDCNQSRPSRQG